MILTFDIGGTKTMWTLWDAEKPVHRDVCPTVSIYDFAQFTKDIISECTYIGGTDSNTIHAIGFSLAGPVSGDRFEFTNTGQVLGFNEIRNALPHIPHIFFLNDLEALAHSIPLLTNEDQLQVFKGESPAENTSSGGAKAIVSLGTGLGVSAITREGIPVPSEGGHMDFAPRNPRQQMLYEYLKNQYDHVSYERLLAGQGLSNIYEFVQSEQTHTDHLGCSNACTEKTEPAGITALALKGDPAALETYEIYTEILGAACSNYALTFMASCGVYIAGGMAPKILPLIDKAVFEKAFADKGRFSNYINSLSVYVIMDETAPSIGAMAFAAKSAGLL